MKKKIFKCEICGKEEEDKLDLEIYHRGCRLSQLFKRDEELEKKFGKRVMVIDVTKAKDPKIQRILDKSKKRVRRKNEKNKDKRKRIRKQLEKELEESK